MPLITLQDVRVAWKIFNDLPKFEASFGGMQSLPSVFKAREDAWRDYTMKRDQYLYNIGALKLAATPEIFYQRRNLN